MALDIAIHVGRATSVIDQLAIESLMVSLEVVVLGGDKAFKRALLHRH